MFLIIVDLVSFNYAQMTYKVCYYSKNDLKLDIMSSREPWEIELYEKKVYRR